MLVWSRSGRFIVWLLAALLIGIIFIAPLAVILATGLAKQWNGVFPTGFTLEHYASAAGGASGDSVIASLITGSSRVFSRFFADPGRRWLCAHKARHGAGAWACSSSFRAPCRRYRSGLGSWSPSASDPCSSTARQRSPSWRISC